MTDYSMKRTGNIIKELREKAGESQEQLAIALNAPNRETITRWENGARDLKREHIIAIAQHFNVSTDYLLGLSDIQTTDTDIQNACKVTGLSETAIKHIAALATITDILKVINSEEIINNSNVSDEIKSKMTELALNAYAALSAMGIESSEFLQYVAECNLLASPIKTFDIFCNHGIFEKICIYISFYVSKLVENKIRSNTTVFDDNFEDYTIWKLQNLISSEFRKIIKEIKISYESDKEASEHGEHNTETE